MSHVDRFTGRVPGDDQSRFTQASADSVVGQQVRVTAKYDLREHRTQIGRATVTAAKIENNGDLVVTLDITRERTPGAVRALLSPADNGEFSLGMGWTRRDAPGPDRSVMGAITPHLFTRGQDYPAVPVTVDSGASPALDGVAADVLTISRWVDEAPANRDRPAAEMLWIRVAKLGAESGEAIEALTTAAGTNPRRMPEGDPDLSKVEYEVLDTIVAGLGALAHLHGNDPAFDVMSLVAAHARFVADRTGVAPGTDPWDAS